MTEIRRMLDTDDPSDPCAALLRAGDAEMPSAEAMEKTLVAVRASAAAASPATWSWLKIGAAGAIGLGIVGLLLRGTAPAEVAFRAPSARSAVASSVAQAIVPQEVVAAPETVPPPVVLPSKPLAARPTAAAPVLHAGSLSDEIACIDDARRAVANGDAVGALRELDRHDRDFPRGAFGPEATVLRVQALILRGDRPSAVTIGQRYIKANPDSPQATRIRSLLDPSP